MWKWKWLVIAGTIMCAVVGGGLGFLMPKIYSIDTILQPGVLKIQDEGKNIYIDSTENISSLITSGAFNNFILRSIEKSNIEDHLKFLKFKLNVPRKSNTLKISYETSNTKLGVDILTHMNKLLLERYSKRVSYYKKEKNNEIGLKSTEIVGIEAQKRSYEQNIKNLQKRVDELQAEMKLINRNTSLLAKEKEKFLLDRGDENNILSALLYSNTIQQNLALANTYNSLTSDYATEIEENKLQLENAKVKIKTLLKKIDIIEFQKENIQNIQILQPPISSPYPVRPRKILIITLTSVIGLFGMLFIVFLVEYVKNAPKSSPVKKKADF